MDAFAGNGVDEHRHWLASIQAGMQARNVEEEGMPMERLGAPAQAPHALLSLMHSTQPGLSSFFFIALQRPREPASSSRPLRMQRGRRGRRPARLRSSRGKRRKEVGSPDQAGAQAITYRRCSRPGGPCRPFSSCSTARSTLPCSAMQWHIMLLPRHPRPPSTTHRPSAAATSSTTALEPRGVATATQFPPTPAPGLNAR